MKILFLVLIGLVLAGCANGQLVTPSVDKYHVILAPESMYQCDIIKSYPKPETLTDLETAKLILSLDKNNKICKHSIEALRKFYRDAGKKFEQAYNQ